MIGMWTIYYVAYIELFFFIQPTYYKTKYNFLYEHETIFIVTAISDNKGLYNSI